jgi:hypothetical protein
MRPLYETKEDLDREMDLARRFGALTDSVPVKLPIEAHADFIMVRNRMAKAVVEIKCRTNNRLAYDTYMLSQHKYAGLASWEHYGLTPILLVSWADTTGYVKIPCPHQISTGGRTDRGDAQDIESVVHIAISQFTLI